jgi:hypothetical protein
MVWPCLDNKIEIETQGGFLLNCPNAHCSIKKKQPKEEFWGMTFGSLGEAGQNF